MLNPIGTQILYTDRFILRPFRYEDAYSMYYFYLSDKDVCEYLEYEAYKNIKDVYSMLSVNIQKYKNPLYFHWAIVDKRNGYVIGSTSIHNINQNMLSCEIGICLSKLYWKKGVGKEVLSKIIEYAKYQIGFKELYAYYMEGNENSKYLLKSLGMEKIVKFDTHILKNGVIKKLFCLKLK